MKTDTQISIERVTREVRNRVSALHGLTAERLRRAIDQFYAGSIGPAARIWEAAEARDDHLVAVTEKRKSDAASLTWQIATKDDSAAAKKQKEVLEDFYNNVRATSAIDEDQTGELDLLLRQMMDARSKKYSVHEVIWDTRRVKGKIRAEFRFVPLWFFERRLGRLRYLETEGAMDGVDLEEMGWLTMACPRALMEPSSKAYLVKTLAGGDWVLYSQRAAMGGISGTTDAPKGSPEWEMAVEVVEAAGGDWRFVKNNAIQVEHIDLTAKGELPMPPLYKAMNSAMSVLWRGGDLSTEAGDSGDVGATLQGGEIDALLTDDAKLISGTLNAKLDRWVLEWHFGRDVEPLAWFLLEPPKSVDIGSDRESTKLASEIGVPISVSWFRDHFGVPAPRDEKDTLEPKQPSANPFGGMFGAGNVDEGRSEELFQRNALEAEARASAADFAPVFERLAQIQAMDDEEEQRAALVRLRASLPELLKDMVRNGRLAKEREKVMGTALVDGIVETRRRRDSHK